MRDRAVRETYSRISAQRAQSDDGAVVEVLDRETVAYRDASVSATIKVDFASVTGLYPASLSARSADGIVLLLAPDQHEDLVSRIEAGLACLGVETERCG